MKEEIKTMGKTDYISRDALLRERHACTRDCAACDFATDGDSWCEGELFVVDVLRIPAADVVERKRGEWVWPDVAKKRDRPYCSVCLNDAFWDDDYGFVTESFCPHCGADMRGDNNAEL